MVHMFVSSEVLYIHKELMGVMYFAYFLPLSLPKEVGEPLLVEFMGQSWN